MSEKKNDADLFYETLNWLIEKLELENIPYMVTGGSAVGFWGQIRTTMDIDVVVQIGKERIKPFLGAIENECYIGIQDAEKAIADGRMFNIIVNKSYFKIDIIPLKRDVYEIEKFGRRKRVKFRNLEIQVISSEDLLISKLQWSKSAGGSERQIMDCISIYKLNRDDLDMDYIKKWIEALNIEDEFKKVTSG